MQAAEEAGGAVLHRHLYIGILHGHRRAGIPHVGLTVWHITGGTSISRSGCSSSSCSSIGIQSNVTHCAEMRVPQHGVVSAQIVVIDVAARGAQVPFDPANPMAQNIEPCIERHSIGGGGGAVERFIPYLFVNILVAHGSSSGVREIVAICGLGVVEAALALAIGAAVRV